MALILAALEFMLLLGIKSWVRRPYQPADRARWFAKADGALRSNELGRRPFMLEGFLLSGIQVSDFSASEIARSTIEAYLATEYRFGSDGSLTLRVGERNARSQRSIGAGSRNRRHYHGLEPPQRNPFKP